MGTAAGMLAEARRWLETALRLRPESGQAWYLWAIVVDFAKEPKFADRLFASERAMQAAPRVERAYYYYALGKAWADLGEHARAFAAVARANGETRAEYPYDRSVDRQSALEAVKGSFNSYPLDRLAIAGGAAALRDTAHFERTRGQVIANREWLRAQLQLLGFEVLPSLANFVFTRHPAFAAAHPSKQPDAE